MSFASIMGIQEDLHLHGQQYSWLTTSIYIAILIVEYPINRLIARVPIGKLLGTAIILWGATLALHAACSNFAGIVTVRTLLGIFESVCQPSFLILSSMWYKRDEQAQTGMSLSISHLLTVSLTLQRSHLLGMFEYTHGLPLNHTLTHFST